MNWNVIGVGVVAASMGTVLLLVLLSVQGGREVWLALAVFFPSFILGACAYNYVQKDSE